MAERENKNLHKTELKASQEPGVPVFSFAASDSAGAGLTPEYFNIDENKFSGYYDAAHKLIFILDETKNDFAPNDLLIINSIDDRKWDDILANDYKVDLEDIRPRVDNK
jgi:hypothetical protein